jgi:hypothetical protein
MSESLGTPTLSEGGGCEEGRRKKPHLGEERRKKEETAAGGGEGRNEPFLRSPPALPCNSDAANTKRLNNLRVQVLQIIEEVAFPYLCGPRAVAHSPARLIDRRDNIP